MILEFVLAVYIALFFLIRVFISNRGVKRSERQFEEHWELISKFKASWDEESSISRFVEKKANRGEVLEKLSDNLKSIYGNNYREAFLTPMQYHHKGSVNHVNWATHLMLSKNGKCYGLISPCGIPLGGIDDFEMSIKFCKEIEKNIRQFHKDFTLVLNGSPKFDNKGRVIEYDYKEPGKSLIILDPGRTDKNYRRLW